MNSNAAADKFVAIQQQQLPIKHYSLSPSYASCAKLLISQIHSMSIMEELKEMHGIKDSDEKLTVADETAPTLPYLILSLPPHSHPITRVEICGIIVGVLIRQSFVSYTIDDGSGVLHCNCWWNQHSAFAGGGVDKKLTASSGANSAAASSSSATSLPPPTLTSNSLNSLSSSHHYNPRVLLTSSSTGFVSTPFQILEMGNVVRVRGQVKQFKGKREVAVESVCELMREGEGRGVEEEKSQLRACSSFLLFTSNLFLQTSILIQMLRHYIG